MGSSHSSTKYSASKSPSIKLFFKGPYQRQAWSLPDSIIFYITKYPSSAKAYQQLIKTCKYFFSKNSIVVVNQLSNTFSNTWELSGNQLVIPAKITFKFWCTGIFQYSYTSSGKLSTSLSSLFKSEIKDLTIMCQIISLKEFLFLSSTTINLYLTKVIVNDENGSIVALEKLVSELSKLEYLYCYDPSININTVEEILKLPHIRNIELRNVKHDFDIENFYTRMKKNKHTKFSIRFADTVSGAYKTRLDAVIDDFIQTKYFNYKPFFIEYRGQDEEKFEKLEKIFTKH